jgi:hypothetical protein
MRAPDETEITVLSDLTLQYICLSWSIFPVDGKHPMVKWTEEATNDPARLEYWVGLWPYRQWGLAIPLKIVVADVDRHIGEDGVADFIRLDGRDPRDVPTPTATTSHGGFHLLYVCNGRVYKNGRIAGTAICIKAHVGFVVLPETYPDGTTNGREWLPGKAAWETSMLPAPHWFSSRLREAPTTSGVSAPLSNDLSVRQQGRAALQRACDRILAAQPGERDNVRHRECYTVGGLVARGDIDEREAYDALLAACQLVPLTGGRPWHKLEERIKKSLAAGEARPLPLSIVDRFMRDLKARMRVRKPSRG